MPWLASSDLAYLATLAVVFAAAVSLVLGARLLAGGRDDALRDRVRRFTTVGPPAPARKARERATLLQATLAPLARLATPAGEAELGKLRASFLQAGFRGERALLVFLALKVLLSVALGVAALWLASWAELRPLFVALAVIAAMAIGFYAPGVYLASRAQARRAAIEHGLPNAIDLLVTCIEAGLGLDAALDRVAAEIGIAEPLLGQELRQAALEMAAGLDRGEAFRRLAERTGVEEMRLLAALVVQTQLFGTSIARSLRVQAEGMRVRRTQRAEERAASVGVKMTVPLIFGIVPALFVVLIGPGVVRIVRHLFPILFRGGG
jgi:tight adherence protein C